MEKQLQELREWAQKKIASGQEPPWAWFQYMKLIETADAILAANGAVRTESSPQSEEHPGVHLRLVGSTRPQDDVPLRPAGLPVQLPM
jgi:hypothetical protein